MNSSEVAPAVRANAYQVLARAFAPPATWNDSLGPELRAHLGLWGGRVAYLASQAADEADRIKNDLDGAAIAHAKLFLGPFEIDAPPYASIYLDPKQRLMGEVARFVAEFYAEAGLEPGPGPRELPDHIALELEFMYFLAFQEAEAPPSNHAWFHRQRSFWLEHLGRWLPEFARKLISTDRHPFYVSLGRLLEEVAAAQTAFFQGDSATNSGGLPI
ncbi:MAG: hypothetical protein DWQ01_07195 [Planctomycetota bacterium]|nr:MAG: hypothetical protein DWQ01_07195 [Planctomycetota bacterium]